MKARVTIFALVVLSAATCFAQRTCDASSQSGNDFAAKVHACAASLGAGGGTIDARNLSGNQSASSDPFADTRGKLNVQLGAATVTSSVPWTFPSDSKLTGAGAGPTKIVFNGGGNELANGLIVHDRQNVEVSNLSLVGAGNGVGARIGLDISGSSNVHIHGISISGFGKGTKTQPVAGIWATKIKDVWIEDNEFTDIGPTPTIKNAYDIVTGYNGPSLNSGLHFNRNNIHDSHTAIAVCLFDTNHSEINENQINENNNLSEIAGNINSIKREGGVVTITTDDTSTVYNGHDVGSTVRITGTPDATLNITSSPVSVVVDDKNTFHFKQIAQGSDASFGAGGHWVAGANNSGYGIMCYTTNIATVETSCHDNTFNNNKVSNTAGPGILLQGSPRSTVIHNIVRDANQQNVSGSHPQGGIAVNAGFPGAMFSDHVTISDNTVENAGKQGIDVTHSLDSIVTRNTVTNSSQYGIRLRIGEDRIVVSNNTISGGRGCIYGETGLKDAVIENNTCNGFGGFGGSGIGMGGPVTNVTISNNDISQPVTSFPISTLSRKQGVVRVVTPNFHRLANNASVQISGASPDSFNGTYTVLDVPNEHEFRFLQSGRDQTGGGGSYTFPGSPVGILVANPKADQVKITDNIMEGAGYTGIDYRGNGGQITGNVVRMATVNGISVAKAHNTKVDNNSVVGAGGYGIEAAGEGDGNTLTRNVLLATSHGGIHAANVSSCAGNITDVSGKTQYGSGDCSSVANLNNSEKRNGNGGALFGSSSSAPSCSASNVRQVWVAEDSGTVQRCTKSKDGYTWRRIH